MRARRVIVGREVDEYSAAFFKIPRSSRILYEPAAVLTVITIALSPAKF